MCEASKSLSPTPYLGARAHASLVPFQRLCCRNAHSCGVMLCGCELLSALTRRALAVCLDKDAPCLLQDGRFVLWSASLFAVLL